MSIVSKAILVSIKDFENQIREYEIKLEANYYYEPGSFLLLSLKKDFSEFRNFSIANAYNKQGLIKLIIKRIGYFTNKIFQELNIGDELWVKYSFGDFLLPFYDKENPIITLSTGTGISPILSFAQALKQDNQESRLHSFHSFKTANLMVGLESLKSNTIPTQLHLYSTQEYIKETEHREIENRRIENRRIEIKDILDKGLELSKSHIYLCGKDDFIQNFKIQLIKLNPQSITTEQWN